MTDLETKLPVCVECGIIFFALSDAVDGQECPQGCGNKIEVKKFVPKEES